MNDKVNMWMSSLNPNCEWQIKELSKEEVRTRSKNSWPFKVVKRGDASFKSITSISELENSFNNTKYNNKNFDDSMRANGRYTYIYEMLKRKLGKQTESIRYLYISLDRVIYMLNDGKADSIEYGRNLTNDLDGILGNTLFSSDIVKKILVNNKNMGGYNENIMKPLVRLYINSRMQMKILVDSKKCICDIFKSDLSFRNVEYIIFSSSPNGAMDYYRYVKDSTEEIMRYFGLNLNVAFDKYVSNEIEIRAMSNICNIIKSGGKIEGLGKLQTAIYTTEALNKETFIKYLVDLKNAEKRKENAEKQEKLNEKMEVFREDVEDIYSMIYIMNNIVKLSNQVDEQGKEAISEYAVWVKGNYTLNSIRNRLNNIYVVEKAGKTDIPINGILMEVFNKFNLSNGAFELDYLGKYLPDNFKNDKHTFNSVGCSFDTKEGIDKIEEYIKEIKKKFFYLFEMLLGLEYAMFGVFMSRYGVKNVWLAKKKVKTLDDLYTPNHPFYISSNVMEKANKAFFLIKYPNDFENDQHSIEEISAIMGEEQYFIKYYLDMLISEVRINFSDEKKYFDEENEKYVRVVGYSKEVKEKQDIRRLCGLYQISSCIIDILGECFRQIHIDINPTEGLKEYVMKSLQNGIDRYKA